MKLAEWQDKQGWSDRELGERLGVSREAVRLWRTGLRRPRADTAMAIERLSGGKVPAPKTTRVK